MAAIANENTPLLGSARQATTTVNGKDTARNRASDGELEDGGWAKRLRTFVAKPRDVVNVRVEHRILFAGFLITLSFSFTQVP